MNNKTIGKDIHPSWIDPFPPEYASSDSDDSKETLLRVRGFIEPAIKDYAEKNYRQVNSGAVWEEEPGRFAADLNTASGLFKLRNANLDSGRLEQSQPTVDDTASAASVEKETTSTELWDQLLSSGSSAGQKAEALAELIADGAREARDYIVSELKKPAVASDWLEKLLFASEQIQISDADLRRELKDLLLAHASSLLKAGRPRSENALWAAIRRYASLVEEESDIQALQPFLEGKASIATRQVALQAIHASFHQAPPKDVAKFDKLRDRINQLAAKYLDADPLVSPENTSLALNAMLAASALGGDDSIRLADRMKEIDNRWLLRRCTQSLEEMLANWRTNGQNGEGRKAAIRNLTDILSKLNEVL